MKTTFDSLLFWLFLNERSEGDEKDLDGLTVACNKTTATEKVRQISELIHPILMFVSDNVKNTEAIKIGLSSMMNTVRGMHSGLLKQVFASNMGLFPTFRLCTRTN